MARYRHKASGEVVTFSDYEEARGRCEVEHFDVALLDLLMPAEPTMLGDEARKEFVGREIAIGFPLVLDISRHVGKIAVATDMNHHHHPMSAAVDWFHGAALQVNGALVRIMHAPLTEDGSKDWAKVLAELTS